jgi:hypothetical protein
LQLPFLLSVRLACHPSPKAEDLRLPLRLPLLLSVLLACHPSPKAEDLLLPLRLPLLLSVLLACHPSPKAEDLLLTLQLPLLLSVFFACHSAAQRRNLLLNLLSSIFPPSRQNNRHLDRSDSQSHRESRIGETPAFRLCLVNQFAFGEKLMRSSSATCPTWRLRGQVRARSLLAGVTARNWEGDIKRHGYRFEWMEIVQVGADQPAGYIPGSARGCADWPADYAETG